MEIETPLTHPPPSSPFQPSSSHSRTFAPAKKPCVKVHQFALVSQGWGIPKWLNWPGHKLFSPLIITPPPILH
uniref:Uncharacterized protein n=1 Tax=Steinernema glaseri TaxID=37863 RepID=A0A1I8AQ05_9BILA